MKKNKKDLLISVGFLAAFIAWTILVCVVDVQPIGPENSKVGFATLNSYIHSSTGVCRELYFLTDWLSLIPIGIVALFAMLGLKQWVRRKHLLAVDFSILMLGAFYVIVMAFFALFEKNAINYRPVLIDGILEASYPSSTTLLVMTVVPTAIMQIKERVKMKRIRNSLAIILSGYIVFMVIGRFISGVHWVTDIVGGAIASAALVFAYRYVCGLDKTE